MSYDLQKAGLWKRAAAWMFDAIMVLVLVVGVGFLLSGLTGYDDANAALDAGYARYEDQYGVEFDITQDQYLAMTEAERSNYDAAYQAMAQDQEVLYHYNMVLNLTLVVISLSILLAIMVWEFAVPLFLGNGQTLGKKIFSLGLVRTDGVQINNMQLFVRALLGKFTIGTMIPVCILLMLFWGTLDLTGTLMLLALLAAQALCMILTSTNSAIHDLLAGTAVVDISSQTIFRSTEDLIAYKKQVAADRAARQTY